MLKWFYLNFLQANAKVNFFPLNISSSEKWFRSEPTQSDLVREDGYHPPLHLNGSYFSEIFVHSSFDKKERFFDWSRGFDPPLSVDTNKNKSPVGPQLQIMHLYLMHLHLFLKLVYKLFYQGLYIEESCC